MTDTPRPDLNRLIALMAQLRNPVGGCPWDLEQSFGTISPYTIEEAYEVADAIERGSMVDLKDELGDLLFQVVFHARMAEEAGHFDFDGVAGAIADKMRRRHPHVFGDASPRGAEAQTVAWESHKAQERKARGSAILDDVPLALPALMRAEKLGKRAGRVGFDWQRPQDVLDKVREEAREIDEAVEARESRERLEHEVGDLLFAAAQLARHLKVDAETALRRANDRFQRRFGHIEASLNAAGRTVEGTDSATLEALWAEAKEAERG